MSTLGRRIRQRGAAHGVSELACPAYFVHGSFDPVSPSGHGVAMSTLGRRIRQRGAAHGVSELACPAYFVHGSFDPVRDFQLAKGDASEP